MIKAAITLILAILLPNPICAEVLYDIDFTAPEMGSYSIQSGRPTIVSSFGGFSDALLFTGKATDYDAINFDLGMVPSSYSIDFDVVTHGLRNTLYAFMVYLHTPEVRDVFMHGGLNAIGVFQPYTEVTVEPFIDGVPYHFSIFADLSNNRWRLSVDGVSLYDNAFNATDIRYATFALNGWHAQAVDNGNVMMALDNIHIEAIPEPTPCLLFLLALLVAYGYRKKLLDPVVK